VAGGDPHRGERRRGSVPGDALQQPRDGEPGDRGGVGGDGGQRDRRVPAFLRVVEPDHGDVLGDAQAVLGQGAHRAERQLVGDGEDGVGRGAAAAALPGEQPGHGGHAVLPAAAVGGGHQRAGRDRAGRGEFLAPAAQPQVGLAAGAVRARADERDPAPPERGQVPHGGAGGGHVVDGDVVVGHPVLGPAQQDERGPVGPGQQVLLTEQHGAEDQPVGEVRAGAVAHRDLPLVAAAGVVEQHRAAVPAGRLDDRAGQLREVRAGQVGHRHGDQPGAPAAQLARGQVRPVAEFGDGTQHTVTGGRPQVRAAVDHLGGRPDRDARAQGHVLETDAHGGSSPSAPPAGAAVIRAAACG
jgi:hypothetical protein